MKMAKLGSLVLAVSALNVLSVSAASAGGIHIEVQPEKSRPGLEAELANVYEAVEKFAQDERNLDQASVKSIGDLVEVDDSLRAVVLSNGKGVLMMQDENANTIRIEKTSEMSLD